MKPRFISDIHLSKDSPHLTNAFKAFLNESTTEVFNVSLSKSSIITFKASIVGCSEIGN